MKERHIRAASAVMTLVPEEILAAGGHDHSHNGMGFEQFIIPLGIATITALLVTVTLGLTMARNRQKIFPWHLRLALITVILAVTHGTIVLLHRFFDAAG